MREHVFKYDRPMDPTPTMAKLEELIDLFGGNEDITNSGGPNEAMRVTHIARECLGALERTTYALRNIILATDAAAGATLDSVLNKTARHALASLGERP